MDSSNPQHAAASLSNSIDMTRLPQSAQCMQAVKLMSPDELIGYLSTQGVEMDHEEEAYLRGHNIGGKAFVRCMSKPNLLQHLQSNLRLGTVWAIEECFDCLCDREYSH